MERVQYQMTILLIFLLLFVGVLYDKDGPDRNLMTTVRKIGKEPFNPYATGT